MSLDESINRFRDKIQPEHEAIKAERQRKWERIKTEAPEIAEFLTEVNQTFGKPAKVAVVIGKERVI